MPMHADLEPHWLQAESLKADLLARVTSMPEDVRRTPPKSGEWSPLQVLSHLLVAERFVTGFASAKSDSKERRANPVVIGLLCRVLRAGIPLPAPEVMAPGLTPVSLETLAADWNQEREKLRNTLAQHSPDEPFGLHPIFGVVTTRQTAGMLAAHMVYHVKRFPKAAR
ncbi:MAG: DinB family protein [Akkermansiaceae bacterium]|nr:DinB family protein [Armatimonadota bacterium]